MIFKKAKVSDAARIADAMKKIHALLDDPDLYVTDTEEDLRTFIDGTHGFALLAMEEDAMAGYFIIRFPETDEDHHLGDFIGLEEEEKKLVVYMDSSGVFPEFRGQRLQNRMLTECERILAETPYRHALSTISPDNPASLQSLIRNGFEVVKTVSIYGGLTRNILYKDLKKAVD